MTPDRLDVGPGDHDRVLRGVLWDLGPEGGLTLGQHYGVRFDPSVITIAPRIPPQPSQASTWFEEFVRVSDHFSLAPSLPRTRKPA